MKLRPIPGVQALEYRKDGARTQRCSRCHRERSQSQLLVPQQSTSFNPIIVGNSLVGIVCGDCQHSIERHIQAVFPDLHAFPFVDERGRLMPNPRCENGHALVYRDDGRGMVCPECDVTPLAPEAEQLNA